MISGIPQSILILILVEIFYCMGTLYILEFDHVWEGESSRRSCSYETLICNSLAGYMEHTRAFFPRITGINGGNNREH